MRRKILIGAISEQVGRKQFVYKEGLQKTEYSLVATSEYIKPDVVYVIASNQTIIENTKFNVTAYEYFLEDMKRVNENVTCHLVSTSNDANSLESLWSTFDQLTEVIQDNDEIYLDVTGGIRAIGVILISMIHYLKQTKPTITVKDVLYAQVNNLLNQGELYSIGYFVQLEDWAIAIQNYVNYGDAKLLLELVKDEDKNSSAYRLVDSLQLFSECMKLCRLKDAKYYYEEVEKNMDAFFNKFDMMDDLEAKRYVDKKIGIMKDALNEKFNKFKENTIFGSVEWNLMHRNYQQVLTILNESIPYILLDYGYLKEMKDMQLFKSVAPCDTLNDWIIDGNNITINKNHSNRIFNQIKTELLTQYSNDSLTFSYLCDVLKVKVNKGDFYNQLQNILDNEKYDLKTYNKKLDVILSILLNDVYFTPYLDQNYLLLNKYEGLNKTEAGEIVNVIRQKKNYDISNLKNNQSLSLLKEIAEVERVFDKNKKDIQWYDYQFDHDKDKSNYTKKMYDDSLIETVEVTDLFIENKELMIELFRKYNRLRKDRNMINHAQYITDYQNNYFEEIISGEYDRLIKDICDNLKEIIKVSEARG